jgi:hypothetical protein
MARTCKQQQQQQQQPKQPKKEHATAYIFTHEGLPTLRTLGPQ